MVLRDLLAEKREAILAVAERHGAFNVRVFGSVARGEETPESDIDFLIDYDIDRVSPWFPVGLMHDLQDLLGREVDVVTEAGLKSRVRDNVMKDCFLL
jgi:predicted nucleotidyltransferase